MIAQLFSILTAVSAATPLCTDPTQKCDVLDLQKYLGGWFEIGRTAIIRNTAQRGCECVEANYSLRDTGVVGVRNTCVANGTFTEIFGQAVALGPSEFQVTFPSVPAPPFAGPNYVVQNVWVDAQGNYERALVVSPIPSFITGPRRETTQFIWILARKSAISEQEIQESLDYVTKAGYNPIASDWQKTDQVTCRSAIPL
jgi:apolipoprotein D and lipocalin family protein